MTFALRASVATRLPANHRDHEHKRNIVSVDNAGLELSRYLKAQKGSDPKLELRNELLDRVCDAAVPAGYQDAFERWEAAVARLPGEKAVARFTVRGRLVVGLGAESVLENAITVNRIWGMPMIPGSALKGLASHYTAQVLSDGNADLQPATLPPDAKPGTRLPPNSHGDLFGTTDAASCITWLDAWYVPVAGQTPFRRDVLTNHHPRYYTNRGTDPAQPPWDFDDPNPVPFVSATGTFLIALQGPSREWVDFAMQVVGQALEHAGAGAKTSSGYGRGELRGTTFHGEPQPDAEPDEGEAVEAFLAEISEAPNDQLNRFSHDWCTRCEEIEDENDKRRVAQAIYARWQGKPKELKRVRDKSWAKPVIEMAGEQPSGGGAP